MFQIFFVIICLFLVLCQYVISTSDSNGVREREHIHDDNIPSGVRSVQKDNVVLYYYPTPGNNGFFNVVYHTKDPENNYVFGEVFWYQTISIEKSSLQEFAIAFNYHITTCCRNHPSKRENVDICEYSFCCGICQMYFFGKEFLSRGIKKYGSSDLLANGKKKMLEKFFNDGKHARKTSWEDFFFVIGNKFLDLSGNQIYSEGKDVNPDFTYLYLLTNRFMYELGYNLKNKSLFLMCIDLMVLALHCKIGSEFLNKYEYYSLEMPFDMIFDSQKEWKQENILQYKKMEDITERNPQYSDDIKSSTLSENTMSNVKLRGKNSGNNFYNLNRMEEKSGIGSIGRSLKHSETQNGFVLNVRTEFEEKLWEDIESVYNDKNHKVDFDYYKRAMPLQ